MVLIVRRRRAINALSEMNLALVVRSVSHRLAASLFMGT